MECVPYEGLNREDKYELQQGLDPTRGLPEKGRMMITQHKLSITMKWESGRGCTVYPFPPKESYAGS